MDDSENAPSKTRVQIDLLPTELERMNMVMRMTGLNTRKDLFNNALSLFEWAVAMVAEGRQIGSITSNADVSTIVMPSLQHAAAYGRRPDFDEIKRSVAKALKEDKGDQPVRPLAEFKTG